MTARPARQVPPSSTRASGNCSRLTPSAVRTSSALAVEQGQGRALADHQIGAHRVHLLELQLRSAQVQHARVEVQTAIAVFRQAGECIRAFDEDASSLQRLE